MNISTMTMPIDAAKQAFMEYRRAVRERHNKEDAAIMRGYKALAQGNQVIDLHSVFAQCPMFDGGIRPRLAISKYGTERVYVELGDNFAIYYWKPTRWDRAPRGWQNKTKVPLPLLAGRRGKNKWADLKGVVPIVPPQFRPARGFGSLYILWEVDSWETVPGDPMLLKHLGGALYAVLATWDLTEIERAVLAGTRA